MRTAVIYLYAALLLAALLVGCATSPMFQRTAARLAPHIAADAAAYVNADASLDAPTRAARLAQASQLAAAGAVAADVTTDGVAAAWAGVSQWYLQYVNADPALNAAEKADRIGRAAKLDKSIADERTRPFGAATTRS